MNMTEEKMKQMKKAIIWLCVLTLLLAVTGCQKVEAPVADIEEVPVEAEGYRVKTLKLEGGTDWGAPSPYLNASRGPGQAKMRLVFASLLEKSESSDVSWLAESWEVNGNSYTFTLFDGLTFHDGKALTTEDVAFTLDYMRVHPPVSNTLGSGDSFVVESYDIVDERTIILHVTKNNADTLGSLGSFVILPKHIWEGVEDPNTFTGEGYLTGSGAYMATAYDGATGAYEFTAFTGWVNGKQAAERVLFVPVSDSILAFESGEIDITSMPPDLKAHYVAQANISYVDKANDFGYKFLINFEKHPEFLDKELRVALYHALDRQAIVDNVFRGAGTVGSAGYVPEGSLFYNDEVTTYTYEPELAKAVFSDKDVEMTLLIADSGDDVNVAELMKLHFEAAGIRVNVVAYDSATRDAMVNSGDYSFALVGNGGWGNNPPNYMRTIFSDESKNKGGNPHSMGPIGYSNQVLTKLTEDQRFEMNFEKRIEMFKEIQKIVSEDVPLIVVANRSTYSMYRNDYYDGWMKTYAYQQAEQNRLSYMDRH